MKSKIGNIGFTGAHGTGKTTLVKETLKLLPDHKQYFNVQRFLNKNLRSFNVSSKANDITQITITSHYSVELLRNDNLVSDRTLIDTFAYADLAKEVTKADEIRKTFEEVLNRYSVIFYVPIEFPVIDDNFRELDEDFRKKVDEKIQMYLNLYQENTKIVTLTGTVYERMKIVEKTINAIKTN
jgi:nicotinamide riboside kinase